MRNVGHLAGGKDRQDVVNSWEKTGLEQMGTSKEEMEVRLRLATSSGGAV